MSECKVKQPEINTIASIGAFIVGIIGASTGASVYLSNGQIQAAAQQNLKATMEYYQQQNNAQFDGFRQQIAKLTDAVNAGPRADQIQDIIRHLSAQDGRLDAMDGRTRVLESGVAGLTARLDGYDAASRAELSKRRP